MIHLLHRYRALPRSRQRLLREALLQLAYCRLLMAALPFRWVLRLTMRRQAAQEDTDVEGTAVSAQDIEWAARAGGRMLPFRVTCLTRSLAQGRLLRRHGMSGTVVIGVRQNGTRDFHAHAWVVPGLASDESANRAGWRILARYPVR